MGKIPISYKAYDNKYAKLMGVSLSLGLTLLIGGIFASDTLCFIIGIIGLILFFIFKYLNYKEAKEDAKFAMEYYRKEVEEVLNNREWSDGQKISKIIELANDGNDFAILFLENLKQ